MINDVDWLLVICYWVLVTDYWFMEGSAKDLKPETKNRKGNMESVRTSDPIFIGTYATLRPATSNQ